MLRNINHSIGFAIRATDGELGKVAEFYFDDVNWAIRYLVVRILVEKASATSRTAAAAGFSSSMTTTRSRAATSRSSR